MLALRKIYDTNNGLTDAWNVPPALTTTKLRIVMAEHRIPRKYGKEKPIPKEIQEEIINLYNAGSSCRKVGIAFGIAGTTVLKVLYNNGVRSRHKREYRPKTGNNEQAIIECYLQGKSTTKIAKKFNVNVTTVNNVLSSKGVEIRKPGNYLTKTVGIDEEVKILYASGLSMELIGKQKNMSGAAIRDVLIRNNIKPRDNSGENSPFWRGGVNKNIDHKRAWKRAYRKHRNSNDPLFKLESTLRSRITSFFRANKKNNKIKARKNNRSFALLGADKQTIFFHIEARFRKGMTWENHGKVWHIDHVKPLASARTEEELIKLFHYTNLQPLFKEENLAKKDRLDWKLSEGGVK